MKTSDFYYDLPEELIAQDPLEDRSSSRLMMLDKETGKTEHHVFREIIDELNPGDCLVINDTKVIPARLIGAKEETGAKIEVLLLKRGADDVWETLVKPGKKARPGAKISFGDGLLVGEVLDVVDEGNRLIHFEYEGIFEEILDQLGQMPLRRISHISFRTRIDIIQSMQRIPVQRQHRQPDFILHRSFWKRFVQKGWRLRRSHFTSDLEPSVR